MYSHISFLDLPPAVRHQIYQETVPRSEHLQDLNPWSSYASILPYRRAYNLLLTCRTIYSEVLPILYSQNRFFIRYRDHKNLASLRNLTPTSVASLHHLTIHLNVSSCERSHECCRGPREIHSHIHRVDYSIHHDWPLGPLSGYLPTLSEWVAAISYVGNYIPSSQLHFSLICDVKDLETARKVVEPLNE